MHAPTYRWNHATLHYANPHCMHACDAMQTHRLERVAVTMMDDETAVSCLLLADACIPCSADVMRPKFFAGINFLTNFCALCGVHIGSSNNRNKPMTITSIRCADISGQRLVRPTAPKTRREKPRKAARGEREREREGERERERRRWV